MTLPLLTAYVGQILTLLAAILLCLVLLYACLWVAWRIYKTVQGWPLLLAAVRHYIETHPGKIQQVPLFLSSVFLSTQNPPPQSPNNKPSV